MHKRRTLAGVFNMSYVFAISITNFEKALRKGQRGDVVVSKENIDG